MNRPVLRCALAGALLAAMAARASAQGAGQIPIQNQPQDVFTFSIGVRVGGGADVRFGELGTISPNVDPGPLGATDAIRQYNDGAVAPDGRSPLPADGRTNSWQYRNGSQVSADGGSIRFHRYSTETLGGTSAADSGAGGGVDVAAERIMGRFGKNIIWGIKFGASLSDINAKVSGKVRSRLISQTDTYLLNGQKAPAAPYTAPDTGTAFDGAGQPITGPNGLPLLIDKSILLPLNPASRVTETSETDVDGDWQIKGSYFFLKAGPQVRIPVSNRAALTFGAGVAGAYLGTTYKVSESLTLTGIDAFTFEEEKDTSEFIIGAYADVGVEYWLTPRTGLFGGATYESLGDYEQTVGGRTAAIKLGGNVGFRLGITTRF